MDGDGEGAVQERAISVELHFVNVLEPHPSSTTSLLLKVLRQAGSPALEVSRHKFLRMAQSAEGPRAEGGGRGAESRGLGLGRGIVKSSSPTADELTKVHVLFKSARQNSRKILPSLLVRVCIQYAYSLSLPPSYHLP